MKYWIIVNISDLSQLPGWNEAIPPKHRPSRLYCSRDDAERELLRLANRTGGEFLLFESVAAAVRHGSGDLTAHVVEEVVS